MRAFIIENATAILIVVGIAIATIPSIRHWRFYMKLQVSLVRRLGQIWEESPHIRGPRLFENSFLAELDEIEKRYGDQLTDQERAWLIASRHQQAISTIWMIVVLAIFVLAAFVVGSVLR